MIKKIASRKTWKPTSRSGLALRESLFDEGLMSLRRHEDRRRVKEIVECFASDPDEDDLGPIAMSMARIANRRVKMDELRRLIKRGENGKIRKAAKALLEAEKITPKERREIEASIVG